MPKATRSAPPAGYGPQPPPSRKRTSLAPTVHDPELAPRHDPIAGQGNPPHEKRHDPIAPPLLMPPTMPSIQGAPPSTRISDLDLATLQVQPFDRLLALVQRVYVDNASVPLSDQSTVRLAEVVLKHTRLHEGKATEHITTGAPLDYSALDEDELAELQRLTAKLTTPR